MTIHSVSSLRPHARLIVISSLVSTLLGGCLGGGGGTDTAATDPAAGRSGTGVASLVWSAPTTNADGSPLVDLQGYNVYLGDSTGTLTRVASVGPNETNYLVSGLAPGTHYFAVSAYGSNGAESDFSNIANKTTY